MDERSLDGPRLSGGATLCAIIVNYNYAQFIAQAIESVLRQTEPFDEVIVVDDGSTDDSLSVIRRFAGRVVVVGKPNGGQLTATIAGLARSRAEYVYVLDADDFLETNFVREVKGCLASKPVKVQCQMKGVDGRGESLISLFPTYPKKYDAARMRDDNRSIGFYICPPTSGNVYRRDYLDQIDLTRLESHEPLDGPPALAAPYFGEVATLTFPLACYRVHGANDSRWDRPDAKLLQGEIDWFERRWKDVVAIVGVAQPPFGDKAPLYIRERRMMLAALGESGALAGHVGRFVARLWGTHMDFKHRFLLTGWAISLLTPSSRYRRQAVYARRSPVNRSALMKRFLVGRKAAPSRTA
ncbi:glycosyltransferase family A protein [Phenylobacterium sp.]|jgi:glycosyltransferase involved in cell wall biosynthesis|uniref:glycosyltransferase family 2 protein n=1 Tax=Phenylobacterium sp. TaxID=1871053 RepID=UPI002F41A1DC